jgi:dihydroorotase
MTFVLENLFSSCQSPSQPILLKQIQILDLATSSFGDRANVLITSDQQIELNPQSLPPTAETVAADHLILGNGLVDLYSSCGEPGFELRETWNSLNRSARHGGFVGVGVLPPANNLASVELMRQHAPANLKSWAAITKNRLGKEMNDLAELAPHVCGFSDAAPFSHLGFLRRAMDYLRPFHKPLMLWAYDRELVDKGVMREGRWSLNYGLLGVPAIAETTAISALIELIDLTRTPIHLMRISTARSVELIAQAQDRGLPITASVTWHHLLLEAEQVSGYNSNLHFAPPLGDRHDRQVLIEGVRSGVIGAIAIDHTPYTYEEKAVAFEQSPSGAIGLEFALPLLWHKLVETGQLSSLELWRSLSSNPASYMGLPAPGLCTIFDPIVTWIASRENIFSLSANSIYLGKLIPGKAILISK